MPGPTWVGIAPILLPMPFGDICNATTPRAPACIEVNTCCHLMAPMSRAWAPTAACERRARAPPRGGRRGS
ncbi:MAG: hypothetical protein J3K34DRAFT_425993 [Monoraphidium minutum]|nr:MAG: hypothetical protein J3K34DRAFT_425993 [Monoraphidium minutum]